MDLDTARKTIRIATKFPLGILSPTWALAEATKPFLKKPGRTRFIRTMNWIYLGIASLIVALVLRSSHNVIGNVQASEWHWGLLLLGWYPFSRCTEIFVAFYRDATDKLDCHRATRSLITWGGRVGLALRSYVELVLNFSVLYAILPAEAWQRPAYEIHSVTDALSYSATTITTSGGGGFAAFHWILQALTAYEIACGLILLVVCFTVYVGHALAEFRPGWNASVPTEAPGKSAPEACIRNPGTP